MKSVPAVVKEEDIRYTCEYACLSCTTSNKISLLIQGLQLLTCSINWCCQRRWGRKHGKKITKKSLHLFLSGFGDSYLACGWIFTENEKPAQFVSYWTCLRYRYMATQILFFTRTVEWIFIYLSPVFESWQGGGGGSRAALFLWNVFVTIFRTGGGQEGRSLAFRRMASINKISEALMRY